MEEIDKKIDKKEIVEELWNKYEKFKETAEQVLFPTILQFDQLMIPAHMDLKENWNDEHADLFIKGMETIVFPKLGIK